MTGPDRSRGVATAAVALAVVCIGLVAFAPTAAAQESTAYVVEQGDQCIEVDPITNQDQTVEEFYDYRNDYDHEYGETTFSSYGTVEYQEHNTSLLMIYEGSEGTSLVIVHERLTQDGDDENTRGSSATFTVTGITPGDSWTVEDDDYEGQDDNFSHYDDYSEITWLWGQGRTDGAAYQGLADDAPIQIEPAFNDEANRRYDNSEGYTGWVHDWKVVRSEDPTDKETLGSMEDQITISAGTCGADEPAEPTASLTAPDTATTGDTVTLDASGSETGENASYEWTVDGQTVAETDLPNYETAFDDPGTYDLGVTVTDDGGTDTAQATIAVEEPLTADLQANPESATVGDEFTFDGSGSQGDVARYEWEFGDGNTVDDGSQTETHSYDAAGEYTVQLTVRDGSGGSDTATRTVEVTEPEPSGPTAALSAPDTATTGDTVTLDASGSESNGSPEYEWTVDGTAETTTDQATYERTFDEPGTYDLGVTVTDEYGQDEATATIEVEEDTSGDDGTQLDASVTASEQIVETGDEIPFDGSGSQGDVTRYEWEFGDDTTVTDGSQTETHSYDAAGEYTVQLTVEGSDGQTASDTVTVTVDDPNEDDGTQDDGGNSGDSGGDSGSSGGDSGSSGDGDGSDDSTGERTVEFEDGVVVTVESVVAGEPISVDVPSRKGDDAGVDVRTIELVPAEDADELTAEFDPVARDVPGRFMPTSALDVSSTVDLESITYEFAVDPKLMNCAGVTDDELSVYADDGDWSAVDTESRMEGDSLVASATVDGAVPVGVGAEGPALFVTGVETDGSVSDSTLDLVVTVRNTGVEGGERNLTVSAGDETTEVPVSLDAGEEGVVETTVAVDDPEDFDLRTGATLRDVQVVTATDLTVEPTTIKAGETVTVEAVLQNHGGTAGEHEAELVLADSVAAADTVQMEPGEEATVTFEQRFESPGIYELSVGDQTETVEVEDDDGGVQEATEDADGFGAVVALLATLVAVLGARLRER